MWFSQESHHEQRIIMMGGIIHCDKYSPSKYVLWLYELTENIYLVIIVSRPHKSVLGNTKIDFVHKYILTGLILVLATSFCRLRILNKRKSNSYTQCKSKEMYANVFNFSRLFYIKNKINLSHQYSIKWGIDSINKLFFFSPMMRSCCKGKLPILKCNISL